MITKTSFEEQEQDEETDGVRGDASRRMWAFCNARLFRGALCGDTGELREEDGGPRSRPQGRRRPGA